MPGRYHLDWVQLTFLPLPHVEQARWVHAFQPLETARLPGSEVSSIHKGGTLAQMVRTTTGCLAFFHLCWYFILHVTFPRLRNLDQTSLWGTSLWLHSPSNVPILHVQCKHIMCKTKLLCREMITSFAAELIIGLLAKKRSYP